MFIISATIFFWFLFIIWTKKDWPNLLLKFAFLVMGISGIFETLRILGYIIRI